MLRAQEERQNVSERCRRGGSGGSRCRIGGRGRQPEQSRKKALEKCNGAESRHTRISAVVVVCSSGVPQQR